jgi:hypothetical protein
MVGFFRRTWAFGPTTLYIVRRRLRLLLRTKQIPTVRSGCVAHSRLLMCLRPSGAVDPVGPKVLRCEWFKNPTSSASPQSLRPGRLSKGGWTGCLERNLYGWTGPVLTDRRCKHWLGWRLVEDGGEARTYRFDDARLAYGSRPIPGRTLTQPTFRRIASPTHAPPLILVGGPVISFRPVLSPTHAPIIGGTGLPRKVDGMTKPNCLTFIPASGTPKTAVWRFGGTRLVDDYV